LIEANALTITRDYQPSSSCCYDNDDDDDDNDDGGGLIAAEGGVRDEPRSESAVTCNNNCPRFAEMKKSFSFRAVTHVHNK